MAKFPVFLNRHVFVMDSVYPNQTAPFWSYTVSALSVLVPVVQNLMKVLANVTLNFYFEI